ncbi:hypothetical protein ACFX2B_033720 [Malus domestica]|uniref:uncharacterized protein n=1 Tax=Malus domestica TaxID=3750 RepID=UPI0010AA685E|nr:uncharacterized protein LOC103411790 [Malus domestica]XP_028957714.1 uncharacterized protein LOC103411790 [Malus domestica]XP_028957715.1 uncharacterized protein LOC103411790 [Malus domestica]
MMNLRVHVRSFLLRFLYEYTTMFPPRVHHHVSSKYPPKGTSFGLKRGRFDKHKCYWIICLLSAGRQTTQVGDLMKLSSKQFISTIWDSLNVPFTNGEDSKILIRLGGNMVVLGCSLDIYASAITRPYLSEAWEVREKRKIEKPLMNWRLPALEDEIDMKDNLKWWAYTVASTVR